MVFHSIFLGKKDIDHYYIQQTLHNDLFFPITILF